MSAEVVALVTSTRLQFLNLLADELFNVVLKDDPVQNGVQDN